MRAYAARGERGMAIQAFERCRSVLGRVPSGGYGYSGGYAYGGGCNGYYGYYGYYGYNGCGYNPAAAIVGGVIGGALNSFGAY